MENQKQKKVVPSNQTGTESASEPVQYHTEIPRILSARFIYTEGISHALASAFASGKNILLSGPGGHGKSEMIETVLRGLDLWEDVYLESFGEGLTEDVLWGGVNLDAMNRETGARIEYHPEYSFLNSEIAYFEEMLDAPSPVLLGLKDTLTRKELRKGPQRFKMKTRIVIGATNHDPDTYADSDDPADKARCALLERFPIQFEVKWPDYSANSYLAMFQKHHLSDILNGQAEKLAEILAEATREGHFVSPRTAIHALEIVYANAINRGHSHVTDRDLADIKVLAGLNTYGDEILSDIENLARISEARADLRDAQVKLQTMEADAGNLPDSSIRYLELAKRADMLRTQIYDISVPDDLCGERDDIANAASELSQRLESIGMDKIRVDD